MCVCVCYMFCVQVPTEARRGCWNLGTAIKGGLWDGHYGCWELNLNPLQEWRMNALNRRARLSSPERQLFNDS